MPLRSRSLIAGLALVSASALPLQAQLGGLTRKAKEKATQAVTGQQPAGALKFDNVMVELVPPVLDRLVAGLQARAKRKGPSGLNANEVRRRAQERQEEAEALNRDRGDERHQFDNRMGEAQGCIDERLQERKREHMMDAQRRFMGMTGANLQGDQSANAKFMQEFQRISLEAAEAAASGDTARQRKAEAAYNKHMGIDPKADTAKARAQCNVPAPPAWMQRADAASAESNALWEEARDLEIAANADAARVSGLTAEQIAMAWERVIAFVAGNASVKFSAAEHRALGARRAELAALVG